MRTIDKLRELDNNPVCLPCPGNYADRVHMRICFQKTVHMHYIYREGKNELNCYDNQYFRNKIAAYIAAYRFYKMQSRKVYGTIPNTAVQNIVNA